MEWLDRMNLALSYIEEHLDGEIDVKQLAQITCHSVSNLQRIFPILAEVSLSEYVRRRRLTMAAFELQNSNTKIIDLAMKYGYESPEAFARAFSAMHGIPPSSARSEGVTLKAYPRISFLLTLKGDVAMDYRIETREAFSVYGIEEIFTTENQENLKALPKFWENVMEDGRYDQLAASTGMQEGDQGELCLINAICDYRNTEGSAFPYMLFAFQTPKSKADGYAQVIVPQATWAVFRSLKHSIDTTSASVQGLFRRIYSEWLPNAPYEKVEGYEMELYYGAGDQYHEEIWIRVTPKK